MGASTRRNKELYTFGSFLGLRSSPKSHNVTGVWLKEDLEWGFYRGRTPLDEFPGCVVEVEVGSVRRNRRIGRGKAVLEAMAQGQVPDAERKAVHLQIPSEDWVTFVKDLRTAIWEVACTFPGGITAEGGRRTRTSSNLLRVSVSREVSRVHRGFEPFVFEFFTTTRDWRAGPAARTSWIFAVGLTPETHAEFFLSNSLGRLSKVVQRGGC